MGKTSSKEEATEAHDLMDRVENEGPGAIVKHVRENLDRWKTEELKIGISGRIKTGKSTFINAVLGLRPNQPGAAKSGSGNTTQHVTPYPHPRNDKIVLFDFPGVGTEEHPKSKYMTKVNASECRFTDVGEFSQLLNHMENNISSLKFESILFSISAISKEVIEKKYQKLKSRVRTVSVGAAAISAEPIPIIDLVINIKLLIYELNHYIDTFGITMDIIESLPAEVKERLNVWSILTKSGTALVVFITQQIGKAAAVVESLADFVFPIIGSLISAPTTYFIVRNFLSKHLDQMKEDAIIVYDNVLHAQTHLHN
ncbi:Hypothetical predicted protein [Mytilus galloprovincialis]|uniref:IRG-type G domain-containing protein n=1 Tax=Mytilus galloprovincialis TaxID=29158 RepID=A0A8B6HMD9_MYTGA|nr:Hypothetical predicted protein [Mytilus galloprovincialis]